MNAGHGAAGHANGRPGRASGQWAARAGSGQDGSVAAPAPRLSWPQVHTWRLRRQHLLGRGRAGAPDGGSAVAVARRLCGVQAQVLSAAELAVTVRRASRTAASAPREVAQALAEGRLVRTWAMRGTLHLLPAEDAAPYLSLLAAARTWAKPSWQKAFVTLDQLEELAGAVDAALSDGTARTREELVTHVREVTGDEHLAGQLGSSWGAALKPLAWQGLVCQGPPRGTRTTFVRPADAVPGWTGLPEPEAAAPVVLPAYLGAFGPADLATFDAWLLRGATPKATLRRWAADLGDELATVDVEGRSLLARAQDVDEMADTRPTDAVRLLGGFDQFVLGPGTGDPHLVPTAHRAQVSRAAGWISPVVVTTHGVVGTWQLPGEGADGDLGVALFPDAPRPDPGRLEAEVERVGRLLRRQ